MPEAVLSAVQKTCARCHAHVERGDLRCPVCAFVIAHDAKDVEQHAMKVFRCTGCGAATLWSAEKRALACAFCGSATALEEIEDPVEQTDSWVPFGVDAPRAKEALQAWLKSLGWFRPSDLVASSTVDNLKAIWWPAWIFDARAHVTWAADSNAGAARSAWAPHSGDTELAFERIVVGASRGLTQKEMEGLTTAYDIAAARAEASHLADMGGGGVIEETFDVQRSAARERVANACRAVAASTIQQGHIPGSRYRKVHVSLVLSEFFTRRVALPAWILAYKYKGKLYRVVVHGQDKTRVLGDAPWSLWKIGGAVVGGVALLAAAALVISLVARR